jgi:hypothetical protein
MKHMAQNGFKALTSAWVLALDGDRCVVAVPDLAGHAGR